MALTIVEDQLFGGSYVNRYIPEDRETTVIIPEGVTKLFPSVFAGCNNIQEVHLPESIKTISSSAFKNCKNLTTINLPTGLKFINEHAFSGCEKLKNLFIPESECIISIDSSAFHDCYALADTNGFIIIRHCLIHCYSDAKEIVIPDGVTTINASAFRKCNNLESVVIPESVESIKEYAFHWCDNLKTVYFGMKLPEFVDHYTHSSFPFKVEYRFPAHAVQHMDIPVKIFNAMNKDNFDTDDYAYILANKSAKSYLECVYEANTNASEVLNKTYALLGNEKIKETRAKYLTEFLLKNLNQLKELDIINAIDFLKKVHPATAKRLEALSEIK